MEDFGSVRPPSIAGEAADESKLIGGEVAGKRKSLAPWRPSREEQRPPNAGGPWADASRSPRPPTDENCNRIIVDA